MKILQKLNSKTVTFCFILVLILLLILHGYQLETDQTKRRFLELVIQILGGFTATLIGVYISLNLSRKEEAEKQSVIDEDIMIFVLKTIQSELAFDNSVLERAIGLLDKDYQNIEFIVEDQKDALIILDSIKDQGYYEILGSGSFKVVARDLTLLNLMEEAYINLRYTINVFKIAAKYIEEEYSLDKKNTKENRLNLQKKCVDNIKRLQLQMRVNQEVLQEIERTLNYFGIGYKGEFIPGFEYKPIKLTPN